MLKNKKGALELSINTIVVIVIGVTLLTLGLVFVRGIITKTTDLSDKAFQDANEQLDSLSGSVNEFLTVAPEVVRAKAGDINGFGVLIKNIEETSYSGVVAKVTTSQNALDKGVKCEFLDGSSSKNLKSPLTPGSEERFNIRVRTT
ncbi:MAG: hypothetical protein AABW45_01565, partial [Nanoarchaeota archaeon]